MRKGRAQGAHKNINLTSVVSFVSGAVLLLSVPSTTTYVAQQPPEAQLLDPLYRVCSCESSGAGPNGIPRQFNDDGTVLKGKVNSNDVGMCQINMNYHSINAQKLGFDLKTKEGNISYANWLYVHEGLKPWRASLSCWGPSKDG